jgi:hypothetical protein
MKRAIADEAIADCGLRIADLNKEEALRIED